MRRLSTWALAGLLVFFASADAPAVDAILVFACTGGAFLALILVLLMSFDLFVERREP